MNRSVDERVHAYLAAFLSSAATAALERDLGSAPPDLVAALRAARRALLDQVEVDPGTEVVVLVGDLEVPVEQAAAVVDLPLATVRAVAAGHDVGPADVGAPPAAPSGPPRHRRLVAAALTVALVGAAVALTVVAGGDSDPAGATVCRPDADQPVCVVSSRLTDVVTEAGPGAARDRFTVGEPVRLWLRIARVDGAAHPTLTQVWYRGDRALYAADFRAPASDVLNVTLAQPVAQEPGDYRVVIRAGDRVLVERSFTLVSG